MQGRFRTAACAGADRGRLGRAIQVMLDGRLAERGYAVTYRDDLNPQYAAKGKALFDWRSAVWAYAYTQFAAVQAGTRAQPSVADFVTEVGQNCPFEWPAVI